MRGPLVRIDTRARDQWPEGTIVTPETLAKTDRITKSIFVLHAVTYQSVPSGFIIPLQISTATMLSLPHMAIRNVGLNTLPVQSGVGIGVVLWSFSNLRRDHLGAGLLLGVPAQGRDGAAHPAALVLQKEIERRKGLRGD